jgi:hypothetical protein
MLCEAERALVYFKAYRQHRCGTAQRCGRYVQSRHGKDYFMFFPHFWYPSRGRSCKNYEQSFGCWRRQAEDDKLRAVAGSSPCKTGQVDNSFMNPLASQSGRHLLSGAIWVFLAEALALLMAVVPAVTFPGKHFHS